MVIPSDDSQYVWIGDLFTGHGVAQQSEECIIEEPSTTDPTHAEAEFALEHNFMPCVLVMSSAIIALHYSTFWGTSSRVLCHSHLKSQELAKPLLSCVHLLWLVHKNFSKLYKEKALQLLLHVKFWCWWPSIIRRYQSPNHWPLYTMEHKIQIGFSLATKVLANGRLCGWRRWS